MTHEIHAVSTLCEDLIKVAILGTGRQAQGIAQIQRSASETDSVSQLSVSQLIGQLDSSKPEAALLSAAAILTSYLRAGAIPSLIDVGDGRPCPADKTPRCNAVASTRLVTLLQQPQSPLLAEWLQTATECSVRVPEEYLPDLLNVGKQQKALRCAITAVLGNRGHWLAAQNPAWSFGVAVTGEQTQSDEIWQVGTRAERLSFLQFWRERNPTKARELLVTAWAHEPPTERAEFLATFAVGLSMTDEEFLESALDDKRKEVRQTAVELLTQLPQSRLVARNIERLKLILKVSSAGKLKGLLGRGSKLEVTLPEKFDIEMARDGIEEKWPGGGKQGQKAGWVQQMIGAVPPTFWEREWSLKPREIIQMASAGEWKQPLLGGLAQAAIRNRSIEWLEVFSEQTTTDQYVMNSSGSLTHVVNAFALLPRERLERLILLALKDIGNTKDRDASQRWMNLLHQHQTPWSPEFSRTLLQWMRKEMHAFDSSLQPLRYSLKNWAYWIPPELYDEAAANWPETEPCWAIWEPVVNEFLHILQMRREMRRELLASRPN